MEKGAASCLSPDQTEGAGVGHESLSRGLFGQSVLDTAARAVLSTGHGRAALPAWGQPLHSGSQGAHGSFLHQVLI